MIKATSPALISGPVGPTLLRMAGPMCVGLLANMLFNLVDTYFVGKLGQQELAAMAFTFPLVFFVTGSSMGMSIGVSSVVSRAIGAGSGEGVKRITFHSLLLGVAMVMGLLAIGYPLLNPILRAMGAGEEMIPLIRSYMIPWACGIVFIVTPMIGNSVIRSTGDTLIPSLVMLVAGGMNVILDPILIFGWGPVPSLGLQGAALATVLAYITVFLVMLILLRFHYKLLEFHFGGIRHILTSWKEVLEIALPAVFTNQMIPVANGVLTAIVAGYGEAALAAWGVSTRLESLMMSPFFALSTVMAPFVGQNTGAGREDRVREALRFCGKCCFAGSLLIWIGVALSGPFLSTLFSDNPETRSLIELHVWIVPLSYGFFAWKLQYTSAFNAQRHPLYSSATFLGRFFVFMIPLAWAGQYFFGLIGLYTGVALGNVGALLLAVGLWKLLQWRTNV
ncbi:MAG: MATE family efflux transporter [Kiritimatiellae bacterium]|jgi:putative MATE family efflux protein|nr:MATE family efflux transporter [Kiritimatiellia bacterium]